MHGDFSLNPLAYRDHVSRVLYQQGRVQLDSDANELTEALLRGTRALAGDVVGPHGGVDKSFQITFDAARDEFLIAFGQYYVDGFRCVNLPKGDFFEVLAGLPLPPPPPPPLPKTLPLREQPFVFPPRPPDPAAEKAAGLFYLDAFEFPVSSAQDDSLREAALLGADTTSRALTVWQVKKLTKSETDAWSALIGTLPPDLPRILDGPYVALNLFLRPGGRLRALARQTETTDPCVISPDARYRGLDNRLFRVEVHDPARLKPDGTLDGEPTFKFSRDNGGEVYPIREVKGKTVLLDSLGRDHRTALRVNDWVEVVDDEVLLMQKALKLRRVVDVRRQDLIVVLDGEPEQDAGKKRELHPILRRWAGPPVPIRLRSFIDLADGVQVEFSAVKGYRNGFRTGDYWLIPARTATGDVVWPRDSRGEPIPVAPHGIDHHFAPLEKWDGVSAFEQFRRTFVPLTMVQER